MSIYERDYVQQRPTSGAVTTFASQVYGWMGIGLGMTALICYGLFRTGTYMALMPFWPVFAFGTLGIAFAIQWAVSRASYATLVALFLGYAGLEGMFFGVVLPAYAAAYGGQVIWAAFGTAAIVYGSALCYGVVTKSDLTEMGRLLNFGVMALMGVTLLYFVASFFVTLTWLHLVISYLGLGIFVGLSAYDAQQIRSMSYQVSMDSTASYKLAIVMALRMYINVIMIFWYLLQIFARRD